MKDPLKRTKVVLRHLPPSLPQQAIMDQIDARFSGRYDWVQFRQGKSSAKHQRFSRVYLNFMSSEDVVIFAEFFNGRSFVNEKGAHFKAVVEYAPSQRVPKALSKKDGRDGTIDKDPDYMQFLEQISKPVENLPSAEIQLERKEAEKAAAGKEAPIVTPLMVFIRQRRAAKNGPLRSSTGSGRASSSRKSGSIISSSPIASSKRSDRRRVSGSTYVVKEGAKEKPMYILASRREEQTNRDKDVIISASKISDPANDNATSSGAIAGSSMSVGAGKGKIILLKSKGKEALQDPDMSAPQKNMAPIQSSPVQTTKNEPSGRIIRGILSNRDLRAPRGAHIRSDSDDRISMDDRYGMANTSGVEKMERSNRSRDRPERGGIWTPLRYSDRPQNLSDSVDRASLSHHAPERRAEIVSVRREEMRGHGGSRGNISSIENGLQRHGNRRGPPRVPKEVESAMGVSEGKHSKRGPSSYNAHERQVWVQKTGSAS